MHENSVENKESGNLEVKPTNNSSQIASAIIVAGLIVAGAVLLKGSGSPTPVANTGTPKVDTSKIRPVSKDEHILGNVNAKIMVVEYSDTECPFCKRFHDTMHQVVTENDNNVAWVYRHYPIPQLHAKATREAEATECAWDQGGNDAFWKYTDELYKRTNSNDSLEVTELPKIAGDIGLNVLSFKSCLENGKYAAKVKSDVEGGNAMGKLGTPFSVILKDGKVVDTIGGAQPIETVRQQIKEALK